MERPLLSFFFALSITGAIAGHLPGGDITYVSTGPNEYAVTLTLFRDCSGTPLQAQALSFASDCGLSYTLNALPVSSGTEVSQLCPADLPNSTCNGGALPGIEVYTVTTTAFMGACDSWVISWNECCRTGALNVDGNPGTYIETRLNSATAPGNNSPVFTQDVIPYVCLNQPVSYNLGVTEPDGNTLRYSLIAARDFSTAPFDVTYETGYTGAEPFTGMTIDSLTGQIAFTPTLQGNIITAVQVDEYNDDGDLVGSVMRDFLFVVIPCPNNAPDPMSGTITNVTGSVSSTANSIDLCSYGNVCFDLEISDADAAQALTLASNLVDVLPEATMIATGTNPVTASICFAPDSTDSGTYNFVITAEDDGCPNTALTTFAYTITILNDTTAACSTTGINTSPAEAFGISPQPASGPLTVIMPIAIQECNVEVIDLVGKTCARSTIQPIEGRTTFTLPDDLKSGRFFLRITEAAGTQHVLPFTLVR